MTTYVIIGGGIAGSSIAYHLSEQVGDSVTVFERQSLASETTYKSFAWFGDYGNETYYRMKRYGMELYNEFLEDPRANPNYALTGLLNVTTDPDKAEQFKKSLTDQEIDPSRGEAVTGVERDHVEYLPSDKIRDQLILPRINTDEIEGGIYRPKVGYMRPQELAFEFIERAKENGVNFRQNAKVDEIHVEDGAATGVTVAGEHIDADHVISAAGPWNTELSERVGLDLPIKHTLAPVMKLKPEEPKPYTLPSMIHENSGISFRKNEDGTVLIGHYPGDYQSKGQRYDPETVGESVPTEFRDKASKVINQLFPFLFDADIVDQWVGIRSLTRDHNPIIGETEIDNLSIAAFNTSGIQLSPQAGRIITKQILGEELPEYYPNISPKRFT